MRILGWLITGFAISLGAPFWFDLLNRMMVIRSTVKPHEKSPEEPSEDKHGGKDKAIAVTVATDGTAVGAPTALASTQSVAGGQSHPGSDYSDHEWSSGFPQAGII